MVLSRPACSLLLILAIALSAGCGRSVPTMTTGDSHMDDLQQVLEFTSADLLANKNGKILYHQRYSLFYFSFLIGFTLFMGIGGVCFGTRFVKYGLREKGNLKFAFVTIGFLLTFGGPFVLWRVVPHCIDLIKGQLVDRVCVIEDKNVKLKRPLPVGKGGMRDAVLHIAGKKLRTRVDDRWYDLDFLREDTKYRVYIPCGVNWVLSVEPVYE